MICPFSLGSLYKNSYFSSNIDLIGNMAAILVTMHCVCYLIILRNNKETGMGHRGMELELT